MTLWTVAHQAPLSIGFFKQEYWSGLPFPPLESLPNLSIEPMSPALQTDSLPAEPSGKPFEVYECVKEQDFRVVERTESHLFLGSHHSGVPMPQPWFPWSPSQHAHIWVILEAFLNGQCCDWVNRVASGSLQQRTNDFEFEKNRSIGNSKISRGRGQVEKGFVLFLIGGV